MLKIKYSIIILLLSVIGCQKKTSFDVDVTKINIKSEVIRFDQLYFESTDSLQLLKKKYPFLFPNNVNDSIWIAKQQNEEELFLYNNVQKKFGNFENEANALKLLFQHIKYYKKDFLIPKIITLIGNLNDQSKIIYTDSILFISLEMYLGKNHEVYQNRPKYLSHNFNSKHLIVDVANAIIGYIPKKERTFIASMVTEGKRLYLLDCYLPSYSNAEKIGYTPKQIEWAQQNEADVWRYFVENKLIYNTSNNLNERFINKAPFSKFYLEIDQESPGRIGAWIGWKIVRAYMNNNNVSLKKMLSLPAQDLFINSKFKPNK